MQGRLTIEEIETLPERRAPTAIVRFHLDGVRLAYTIRHKRRGQLLLAPPEAADRGPGAALPADALAALRDAIEATPAADPELRRAMARSWTPAPRALTRLAW